MRPSAAKRSRHGSAYLWRACGQVGALKRPVRGHPAGLLILCEPEEFHPLTCKRTRGPVGHHGRRGSAGLHSDGLRTARTYSSGAGPRAPGALLTSGRYGHTREVLGHLPLDQDWKVSTNA